MRIRRVETDGESLASLGQRKRYRAKALPTGVALAVAQAFVSAPVFAATVNVTTGADVTATDTFCSLREAVTSINGGAETGDCVGTGDPFGSNDSITFSVATASLTNGQISIESSVTVNGGGVSIEGNNTDRLFVLDRYIEVTINESTLSGGSASVGTSGYFGYGGAAFVPLGTTLTITNSTVTGNTASRGGGVGGRYGVIDIVNSSVQQNSAGVYGGGIHIFGGNGFGGLTITSSSISNNQTGGNGGGFSALSNTNVPVTLNDADVQNNTATAGGSGGGIYARETSITIENSSVISNNGARYSGGGMLIQMGKLDISNSTVQSNSVTRYNGSGGGIYIDRAELEMPNTTVTQNQAASGGGISVNSDSLNRATAMITNSSITENLASNYDGGGIFVQRYASLTLSNSSLDNNSANLRGGAIHALDTLLTINGGSVNNNLSTPSGTPNNNGGAIYAREIAADEGKLYINDAIVSGNEAGQGGALFINSGYLKIDNTTLSDNSTSFQSGGAMRINASAEGLILNSTLSGNSATNSAGGMFIFESSLTISNSTLFENTASSGAGALYMNASTVDLVNITMTDNRANGEFARGGGLRSVSGGAGSILNIYNSLISGNLASDDKDLDITGTTVTTANNVFGDSSAQTFNILNGFNPDASDILASSNGTDPTPINQIRVRLANNGGDTETVGLPAGSPALNSGDNTVCAAAPVSNLDQRGEVRPLDAVCDIGAFEGVVDFSMPFVIPIGNGRVVIIDL